MNKLLMYFNFVLFFLNVARNYWITSKPYRAKWLLKSKIITRLFIIKEGATHILDNNGYENDMAFELEFLFWQLWDCARSQKSK